MFAAYGKCVYRWRLTVLVAGWVYLVVAGVFGTGVVKNLKGGGFDDPNSDSSKAALALHDKLGRDEGSLIVLFSSKDGLTVDKPEYKQAVEATLAKING